MDVWARCAVDETIERVTLDGVAFPLGAYPVEQVQPLQGFASEFESADAGNADTEWELWPDRYVYDIVISADRLESLCRHLFSLLPARVFPILDFIGHDAYREVDPYISYELMGLDAFLDAVRRYKPFFFEDGMCGFGALSDDPFFYIFVDEHKIVTVRAAPELKEEVEAVLTAFDLQSVPEPAGADAAAHEHRGVLVSPREQPDLLSAEQIVEQLRDEWRLTLNVDAETNTDDEGRDLGLTPWRCVLRTLEDDVPRFRYAEVLLIAPNLAEAEELCFDAWVSLEAEKEADEGPDIVAADRMTETQLRELVAELPADRLPPTLTKLDRVLADQTPRILAAWWVE